MMTLNEICYNPAISTFLSIVDIAFKHYLTHNMPLHNELTGRYTHHKQMKVVYYYTEKDVDDCHVKVMTFAI
jgi:hypothetical protein